MADKVQRAIRFKYAWMGRPKGYIDRLIAPGVMQTLVNRGAAEFVNSQDAPPGKRRRVKRDDET